MGRRRLREGPTALEIKAAVRKRDGMRCTRCGLTNNEHLAVSGRSLDVHRLAPGSVYTLEGCVTLCRRCHGSEPKRERGAPDDANPTILIDADLVYRLRVISCVTKESISDMISPLIRAYVNRRYRDAAKIINEDIEGDA